MRPEVGKKSRSGNQENRKPRREKTEEGRRAVSAKVGRKSTRKKTEFQFAAFPPRSIRPPHGLAPVPNLAEAVGNMAASLGSLLLNQLLDEQQVGFPNNPAPNH
jgi:hypothetical protein